MNVALYANGKRQSDISMTQTTDIDLEYLQDLLFVRFVHPESQKTHHAGGSEHAYHGNSCEAASER